VIVLDASLVVELLLQTPRAILLNEDLLTSQKDLHAPHLIDVEVTQALRSLCARGELGDRRAQEAATDLADLPLFRHSHELLLGRAWELRSNLTIYDGVYVALAELLEVPLWTLDQRIAGTPELRADVRVIQ